jgi:hypothetical protein
MNHIQYTGSVEQTVHDAIDQSKVISGDVVQIPYSYAAEQILCRECETSRGVTYSGTDIDGNGWTVELVP